MRRLLLICIVMLSSVSNADSGTPRHLLTGYAASMGTYLFVSRMLHLKPKERYKAWIFTGAALVAGSLLMEGIQAHDRRSNIDMGDVGTNILGGAMAFGTTMVFKF